MKKAPAYRQRPAPEARAFDAQRGSDHGPQPLRKAAAAGDPDYLGYLADHLGTNRAADDGETALPEAAAGRPQPAPAPVVAYLLLGSNLGDRAAHLAAACRHLAAAGEVVAASGVYETAPWGPRDQPDYLNQALALRTELPAPKLLAAAQAAEQAAGRQRAASAPWGSRTLDVDILLYGAARFNEPDLQVPHPRLPWRRFALVPLADIAPADLRHPVLGRTVAELLAACPDPLPVWPWAPA